MNLQLIMGWIWGYPVTLINKPLFDRALVTVILPRQSM